MIPSNSASEETGRPYPLAIRERRGFRSPSSHRTTDLIARHGDSYSARAILCKRGPSRALERQSGPVEHRNHSVRLERDVGTSSVAVRWPVRLFGFGHAT